jgi:hypothetical protein
MFEQQFVVHGYDQSEHARHYLSGLLGTQRRKNLEWVEADVAESNYEGLQQFISNPPWDHRAVMDQVAQRAEAALGGAEDTALYMDETSFVKKGQASVGVQRQYCGRLGKLENCQVGVLLRRWGAGAARRWWTPAVPAGGVGLGRAAVRQGASPGARTGAPHQDGTGVGDGAGGPRAGLPSPLDRG